MASQAETQALAQANRDVLENIQDNTISPQDFNANQKRTLIESVFPSGVAIDVNDSNIKVGDKVFGEKSGINNGNWFFGEVLIAPPTQDSHIEFKQMT